MSSSNLRPMSLFAEKMVLVGLVTACLFAAWPTRRSPDFVNATTDGVVRAPSEFSRTVASPPSMTAMHEFVVPKSIPNILAIIVFFYNFVGVVLFLNFDSCQTFCNHCAIDVMHWLLVIIIWGITIFSLNGDKMALLRETFCYSRTDLVQVQFLRS